MYCVLDGVTITKIKNYNLNLLYITNNEEYGIIPACKFQMQIYIFELF